MKIGYARISTREQSLELQATALKEAGCERIYQEVASGAKTERPILDDLLKNIREGDTLIIWKLDRLGRRMSHLLHTVEDLMQRNIAFVSLNDPIDTTTSHGRLVFSIFASIAEYERAMISERTIAGLNTARARGRFGGRKNGFAKGWEEKAMIAETLYKSREVPVKVIANQLRISQPTVYTYLRQRGVQIGPACIKKIINVKQPQLAI